MNKLASLLLVMSLSCWLTPVAWGGAARGFDGQETDSTAAQVAPSEAASTDVVSADTTAEPSGWFAGIQKSLADWREEINKAAGVDDKIDVAFRPVADYWESLVLTSMKVFGQDVPIVLVLLVFSALFFTLYFGFINIRLFPLAIKVVMGKFDEIEKSGPPVKTEDLNVVNGDIVDTIRDEGHDGEVSHFQALATAVSGTVGLGNIGSVAIAIAVGGPGATFWMIVCGLLGMSTKFVECTLGVAYRDVDNDGTVHGGPMYYLKKGFERLGLFGYAKFFSVVFAVLCVGASFGGGNVFQSNQATEQIAQMITSLFPAPEVAADATTEATAGASNEAGGNVKAIIGLVLAVLVGLVIIGGIKRIATVTEKVVPFMAILYVLACLVLLAINFRFIGTAFSQIFTQAFSPQAGLGGILGVMIVGFQRAAFSNEAGAGSAAIAHSAVKTKYAASEGIVALLEPFIDTVVICTMTALVIITFNIAGDGVFEYGSAAGGVVALKGGASVGGVSLTSAAFESGIGWFKYLLTISVVLFAFSTMISWSYYGLQSWKFLFGRSKFMDLCYKILFLIFVVVGAAANTASAVKFSDAMILALVFPNMVGLFLMVSLVKKHLSQYLQAIGVKRSAN